MMRRENTSYTSSDGPWYARTIEAILNRSGPIALIALALVAFLSLAVWGELKSVSAQMGDAKNMMGQFVAKQNEIEQARTKFMEKQLRISKQTCLNGAKTDEAIRACSE